MLEKVAAIAVEEAPVVARLSEDAFQFMRAAAKDGLAGTGKEIQGSQIAGRAIAADGGAIAHFPGHSTVKESLGGLQLVSADGAKLHLTPTQVKLELVDGTIVSHEGQAVTTRLPGGDILRQEKVATDHVVTTLNGNEVNSESFGRALPDGAHLSNYSKHASSMFLKDGTYVGNSTYGFSLYRGVDPARGWAGGQADITVESSYYRGGTPSLVLHNRDESNMFMSNFLSGTAEKGVSLRTHRVWASLKEVLK